MENLNKQGGEKQRKMESKMDSHAHAPTTNKEKIKEKVEEQIVKEMAKEVKKEEMAIDIKESEKAEAKNEETKTEKKTETKKPVVKKEMAFIKMGSLPVSTKQSREISRFLIGKTPEQAIKEMQMVVKGKMAVPMRGEIPHRKGPMMSGRYPINTAKEFINVLKSLQGNANVNGINNPVITIASASWASRPQRKGGMRFKRTHLYMEVREAKEKYTNSKKQQMENKKHSENKKENKK